MKTTRLAESAHLFSGSGVTTRLRDGRSVTIRAATPRDAGDVSAMHVRCSTETVRHRYHSVPSMTGRFLSQLVGTDIALVAEAPNRAIVALANLGRDDGDAGELAVIVEDAWQRAGLGSALLDHLISMARLVGYREVYTVALPGNHWFRGTLTRYGQARLERSAGYDSMRLALRPPLARLPEQLGATAAA
ncbi:GNAT family N-acetyltransferase [Jiangella aurantiaca]|uniref:GNAT family N-acetyltransferase n=1 Tax=Jiangella aurantiaca TaxID=2530373 RepID=A0A4R5A9B3_9ACTN|nr:GNAT family N-acetyltransferase [Jiangella aurantiaca]TDD68215.1 GNAT family N-acetyltransferase [Jiangella aurantiaca]